LLKGGGRTGGCATSGHRNTNASKTRQLILLKCGGGQVGAQRPTTAIPSMRGPQTPLRTSALASRSQLSQWPWPPRRGTQPLATASAPCSPGGPPAWAQRGPAPHRVPPPSLGLTWSCGTEPERAAHKGASGRSSGGSFSCNASPAKVSASGLGGSSDSLLPSYMRTTLSARMRRAEAPSPRLLTLGEARFLSLPAQS
jgi:hypothetical protein